MAYSVAYICDRKRCERCSWPQCKHTIDVQHAVNFHRVRFPEPGLQDGEPKFLETNWYYENGALEPANAEFRIYDEEELHEGVTVQILKNTVTGDVSIAWWDPDNGPED